jgi:phospholipase C
MGGSNVDIAGEVFADQPVGLGPRVPMLAISPWSAGGWVNSQVFDHTSILRFLETRFEVSEANISPWRRAVCGDLTSVFDFEGAPLAPARARWPDASALMARVDAAAALPAPGPPQPQSPAVQESGVRPARALPYSLHVHAAVAADYVRLTFVNDGHAGAALSVWPDGGDTGPWFHTVAPGTRLAFDHPIGPDGYDLSVHGPNGFFRQFVGAGAGEPEVQAAHGPDGGRLDLTITSPGAARVITVTPIAYPPGEARAHPVDADRSIVSPWRIERSAHWYDLVVTSSDDRRWLRRLSGHVETGRPSLSDPAIGRG